MSIFKFKVNCKIIFGLTVATCLSASENLLAAKIGLVQYDADVEFGNYAVNLAAVTALADQAVTAGATLVQLPEGSIYGYASEDQAWCSADRSSCQGKRCRDINPVAELIPNGLTTKYWQDWAAKKNAIILFNIPERDGANNYNTTVAVGPRGYLTKYRKRALYVIDQCYAEPGQQSAVISFAGQEFGLMTCMDANYYEYFAEYRNNAVDSILISMDWDQTQKMHLIS